MLSSFSLPDTGFSLFFAADSAGKIACKETSEYRVLRHQSVPQKTGMLPLPLKPSPFWAPTFLPQLVYLACMFLGQSMALFFHAAFSTAEPWSFDNEEINLLESFLAKQLHVSSPIFRNSGAQQSQVSQRQPARQEWKPGWLFGNVFWFRNYH